MPIPIIVDEWSFLPPLASPLHRMESDDNPQDPSGDVSEDASVDHAEGKPMSFVAKATFATHVRKTTNAMQQMSVSFPS